MCSPKRPETEPEYITFNEDCWVINCSDCRWEWSEYNVCMWKKMWILPLMCWNAWWGQKNDVVPAEVPHLLVVTGSRNKNSVELEWNMSHPLSFCCRWCAIMKTKGTPGSWTDKTKLGVWDQRRQQVKPGSQDEGVWSRWSGQQEIKQGTSAG